MQIARLVVLLAWTSCATAVLVPRPALSREARRHRTAGVVAEEAKATMTLSAAASHAVVFQGDEDWAVIDVRMAAEYRLEGHIEGSVSLPSMSWEHGFFLPLDYAAIVQEEEYALDAPLLLACGDGERSTAACETLRAAGFTRAFALEGGIAAWEEEDLPLVTDDDGEDGLVGAWV